MDCAQHNHRKAPQGRLAPGLLMLLLGIFTLTSHAADTRTAASVSLAFTGSTVVNVGSATLEASVTGTQASGTVRFEHARVAGPITICNAVPIIAGKASCVVTDANRPVGTQLYQASYSGDLNNLPASRAITAGITSPTGVFAGQVVAAVVTVTTTPIQPRAGQPLTVNVSVISAPAGGFVFFSGLPGCLAAVATALPGTDDISVATCTLTAPAAGNYDAVVSYLGGGTDPPVAGAETVRITVLPTAGPLDYTDLWWGGVAENGWGASITQHGDIQFNAFYIYDAAGKPVWQVMPGGTWSANFTRFSGPLYQPTSAPFSAYNASSLVVGPPTGSATIDFLDASTANLSYTINGVSGSKRIVRQPFGTTDPQTRLVVNDLWWAAGEQNGWGLSIAQSDRTLFAVWYTYGADGKATWFVLPGGAWTGATYAGPLYATTSSAWLGVAYNPAALVVTPVGVASIKFIDGARAIFSSTVNGSTQSRVIYRQPF